MERLRKSLGVSSLENTFENFLPWPGTEEALEAFKALVEVSDWKMLLCYGGVGNGKTHLCEAVAIELYKKGIRCRVAEMTKIMRTLKSTMNPGSTVSLDTILDNLCQARCLIIDDVGMGGSDTVWQFGKLEEIIVARYREHLHREDLLTILTTNLDLKELPERIVSRFRDPTIGRVVLNSGEDFRPQK